MSTGRWGLPNNGKLQYVVQWCMQQHTTLKMYSMYAMHAEAFMMYTPLLDTSSFARFCSAISVSEFRGREDPTASEDDGWGMCK